MIGLDTSFLVALAITEHTHHSRTQAMLRRDIIEAGEILAVTPDVLGEYIHATTDPRRFRTPVTMAAALSDAQFWWQATHTTQVFPTKEAVTLALEWMIRHQLGRKRIIDTMLAATLHMAGARKLLTLNPDDCRVFGVFELLVP